MLKAPLIFLFFIGVSHVIAQPISVEDSLRNVIQLHKGDTAEVSALALLGSNQTQLDSGVKFLQQGLLLAEKLGYKKGEADCLIRLVQKISDRGQAIQYCLYALRIFEELKDAEGVVESHLVLQWTYRESGDYKNSLIHAFKGEQKAEAYNVIGQRTFPGSRLAPLFLAEIGGTYLLKNQLDSASFFTQQSIEQNELFNGAAWNFPVYLLATIQSMQGNYELALKNYRKANSLAIQNGFEMDTLQIQSGMSTLFLRTGQLDSAIYYAYAVAHSWQRGSEIKNLMEAVSNLHNAYRLKGNKDSTLKYIELHIALKDSLYSKEKDREIQSITFSERLKEQQLAAAQARYEIRLQLYSLIAGLVVLILTVVLLWRNNRQKQKAKTKIGKAYADLEARQAQLVQSEKMASLGELTAGIAHEIQNPLNFVNNFSEVNKELLTEIQEEIGKGNFEEVIAIVKDVIANEEKINHHGKRADSIVKGMLQHSRSSSGVKEPTDINALADEYLRLSYHGLRAKDKSFNATLNTDYDQTIGNINIIPQDIGRVILNLINNAFYAVNERQKLLAASHELLANYEPTVSISIKKEGNKVLISIKDNGNGIPQKILDKIFQPFFTTKPTGQGTGLGLSLSYDIVKANGGELAVETKEGKGSKFTLQIPIT